LILTWRNIEKPQTPKSGLQFVQVEFELGTSREYVNQQTTTLRKKYTETRRVNK